MPATSASNPRRNSDSRATGSSYLGALALAVAAALPQAASATAYLLEEFVRPSAISTALWDINNVGQMVGYSVNSAGALAQGYVFDGVNFTTLAGPAGAISSYASGISDTGLVVGSFTLADGTDHGFIYSGGTYTVLDATPTSTSTVLRGISPDGRYISGYYDSDTASFVGFVYDTLSASIIPVGRPNSGLTIVQGINNSYVAVGSDFLTGFPAVRPAFTFDITSGTRTDYQITGARRTALRAIDNAGVMAGWYMDTLNQAHGFVGNTSVYDIVEFTGATSTYVEGNNDAGVLVGVFDSGGAQHAFIARAVPEPQTWALFAAGLGLVAAWRRRRA